MKYLLLADIHGNIYALEKVLNSLSKDDFDEILFLGDYISDVPKSHEVIEFIRDCQNKYKSHVIIGNREERVLDYLDGMHPDWSLDTRFADAVCTANQLTDEDIKWIKELPSELVLEVNNKKIHISHDYSVDVDAMFDFKIFGHEHKQFNYMKEKLQVINPGSVGISCDEKPVMQYAILEINDDSYDIKNFNIEYDMTEVLETVKKCPTYNSLFRWGNLVERILLTGTDYIYMNIKEYERLRLKDGIKEESLEYWNKAIDNCNIFKK